MIKSDDEVNVAVVVVLATRAYLVGVSSKIKRSNRKSGVNCLEVFMHMFKEYTNPFDKNNTVI